MKDLFKRFFVFSEKAVGDKRASLLFCILAGAVGALPYFIERLFIFTFLSLVFFFYVLLKRHANSKGLFLPYFCYYLGLYFPLYSFLSELYPYDRFGFDESQATFVLICSCVLIPILHATVNSLIMMISKLFPKHILSLIGHSALWVVCEFVFTFGTLAFPWGGIAVSLTGFLPYLQTASLFGKYFITFVTVFSCSLIALSIIEKVKFRALTGVALIVSNLLIGTILFFIPTQYKGSFEAAAVQGNALADDKWAMKNRKTIFERYISMTKEAAENGAELILLPESAFPQSFSDGEYIHEAIAEITKEYGVTVLAGVRYLDYSEDYIDEYNSCIAVLPDGNLSSRYDKRHLVPFGEFIPFVDTLGELFPFLADFNESSSSFIQGEEPVIIETVHGKIAPLVCFDSIFPAFSREAINEGAGSIAVVTNDSWFFDSVGVYTHLRHSQLRAIENRRFVSRAANTGISAFINEKGQIIENSEPLVQDAVYSTVYNIESKSLYSIIGDSFVYISFLTVLTFVLFGLIKKNKK